MTPHQDDQWAELERLAGAVIDTSPAGWWIEADSRTIELVEPIDRAFIAAANPSTILQLIAAARQGRGGDEPEASEPKTDADMNKKDSA